MSTTRVNFVTATLHASSSITTGNSTQDDFAMDSDGLYRAYAQIDLDIASGSPSGDVVIEVFLSSDGSNYDTIPSQKVVVNFTATGNKKKTVTFEGFKVRVKVTNNTGASVTYVGRLVGVRQQTL